jgi:phosphonate transport system substrate-binding protein
MRYLTALLVFLVSTSGFATDSQRPQFTFTAIPDQNEAELIQRFQLVADYLSEELDVDAHYIPVKSYPAAITAFRNNQVQLAWFGGLSGVQARKVVAGSQAIAQGYEDQFFKTYIIAHSSTGLTESADLQTAMAGKTFTFGSKGSTSGRLMPEFHLRNTFNEAPEDTFSRVGFSGDHSRTIALVQSGAYELGAVNYSVWDKALANGDIDPNLVSVIWTTPEYADYQWTARGDIDAQLGAGFQDKLTAALLKLNDKTILDAFPRTRFVPADNNVYSEIEQTAKDIGLLDDF